MACNNCFNGCAETTSDKCVMYTGLSYPELGIETGDSLLSVETSIITFLQTALDGTGIIMTINPLDLCPIVISFLPVAGPITLVDYVTALIQTACSLQTQIAAIAADVSVIEANYTIGCLTGVAPSDGTHAILQAVITKLCATETAVAALALDLVTNYINIDNIDTYISAYITANPSAIVSPLMRNKMVPYTVVEYYGSLSFFDGSGAGTGDWAQVYLCNGNNNTPDKRGRSPIGVVTVPGGGAFAPAVDPANPVNPNYTLEGTGGSNTVTLTIGQIPAHTHVATVTVTDPGHTHDYKINQVDVNTTGTTPTVYDSGTANTKTTESKITGISVGVVNAPQGSNGAHANIHPVLACYYIIYIPTP